MSGGRRDDPEGGASRLSRFFSGLGALASIWPPPESSDLPYPHRDEANALLADGWKVGEDMRVVFERGRPQAGTEIA
ncbi:hypothetical protein JCM2811A_04910 [Methylorubrum rhodinum]